jgi:hypothetical protein
MLLAIALLCLVVVPNMISKGSISPGAQTREQSAVFALCKTAPGLTHWFGFVASESLLEKATLALDGKPQRICLYANTANRQYPRSWFVTIDDCPFSYELTNPSGTYSSASLYFDDMNGDALQEILLERVGSEGKPQVLTIFQVLKPTKVAVLMDLKCSPAGSEGRFVVHFHSGSAQISDSFDVMNAVLFSSNPLWHSYEGTEKSAVVGPSMSWVVADLDLDGKKEIITRQSLFVRDGPTLASLENTYRLHDLNFQLVRTDMFDNSGNRVATENIGG